MAVRAYAAFKAQKPTQRPCIGTARLLVFQGVSHQNWPGIPQAPRQPFFANAIKSPNAPFMARFHANTSSLWFEVGLLVRQKKGRCQQNLSRSKSTTDSAKPMTFMK
jgi:hypothetical protein